MSAERQVTPFRAPHDSIGGVTGSSSLLNGVVVSEAGRSAWKLELTLRQIQSVENIVDSGVISPFVEAAGLIRIIGGNAAAVTTVSVPTGEEEDSMGVQLKFNFRHQGDGIVVCEQIAAKDLEDGSFVMILGDWMEVPRYSPNGKFARSNSYRYDGKGVIQAVEGILTREIVNDSAHRWMDTRFVKQDEIYRPVYHPGVGRHKVIYPPTEPAPAPQP